MSEPPDSFTLVHYVRNLKVNEKTARRRSGNAARSLRSLRSTGVAILRAWNPCIVYLPSWNEGNDVNDGVKPPRLLAILLVHFRAKPDVNDVNEGGAAHV
jgi:hypothetical protein